MSSGGQFTWIPVYEEIATMLLGYGERQDELCKVVEEILGEHYEQMDPLTFFSMFNGKRKNFDKRVEAVRTIIERFGLKAAAPTDFDGLPDAFENLVTDSDPLSEDTDGDGVLNTETDRLVGTIPEVNTGI